MAKPVQNPGLDRTARLLDLVPFLIAHQGIALADLAAQFSISTAQLTEDLTTLWMCGLPGYTALELMDLSFDTGFVTISNAETLSSPRKLNRDEVLALLLGLQTILEGLLPENENLTVRIESLISKLTNFLDTNVEHQVQAGTSVPSLIRGTIEAAIASRTSVRVTYHSLTRDTITDRIIHPLEFSTKKESEYLYAYCENSQGYRTFKMDRILSASPTPTNDERLDSQNAKGGDSLSTIKILVSSRSRDVAERFNIDAGRYANQVLQEVTIQSFTPDWAVREIMSFGGEVTLESPQTLREILLQRSQRALGGYI